MFKMFLFLYLPGFFILCQLLAWFIGESSLGNMILSIQMFVVILELRRYLWSERDYHEAGGLLFRKRK